MTKLIYILFFICFSAQAQNYYCYGSKENIETLEYAEHKHRKATESNYNCYNWSIIQKDSLSDNWFIVLDKKDISTITIPVGVTCSDELPKTFITYEAVKVTTDKRYVIPITTDEKTVIVTREDDGKIIKELEPIKLIK